MEILTPHINHLTMYATILLSTGLLLRYIISKRRFSRRGVAGFQHFKSYKQAFFITALERILFIVGNLLIIGAVILYLLT